MLTKKDFILFAAQVRETLLCESDDPQANHRLAVAQFNTFVQVCQKSNPRFNVERFRTACGFANLPTVGK